MGDMGDIWKGYRQLQQARRAIRLPARQDEILSLRGKGFDVVQLTEYQFRVDGKLDLFPIHRRYHHIPSQKRGGYKNTMDIAVRFLRTGERA